MDAEGEDTLALRVAYQMARALVSARANRREAELDVEGLAARLKEISEHLEAVRAMKTNLTGAVTNIQGVKQMLDQMRENIELAVEGLMGVVEGAPRPAE